LGSKHLQTVFPAIGSWRWMVSNTSRIRFAVGALHSRSSGYSGSIPEPRPREIYRPLGIAGDPMKPIRTWV
jgi:hypothetical protein